MTTTYIAQADKIIVNDEERLLIACLLDGQDIE
jgi:hypothetical protein